MSEYGHVSIHELLRAIYESYDQMERDGLSDAKRKEVEMEIEAIKIELAARLKP